VEPVTVRIYEREAANYRRRRRPVDAARAASFAAACVPGYPAVDLGCGPGLYLRHLPHPVVGLDAAAAMLELARAHDPGAAPVRGDLEALPLADRSLGGAWARNSYLHLPAVRLPLALARLHRALVPGAPLMLSVALGEGEGPWPDDDIPGRFFCCWQAPRLLDVLAGAGFEAAGVEVVDERGALYASARRARTLPDTVGGGMRLLVCGLNPSEVAADAGFGFAGRTNRFWAAALEAGVVTRPRDPLHALTHDRVGMTDLVKRATPRAAAIAAPEYRAGATRVAHLVTWLHPAAVCFVGLEGWRVAVDRDARPGWQPAGFAGVPAYVMPSTSGLNARTTRSELAGHLRAALAGSVHLQPHRMQPAARSAAPRAVPRGSAVNPAPGPEPAEVGRRNVRSGG
jgi:TDG/mug DNA glycosylase family protein